MASICKIFADTSFYFLSTAVEIDSHLSELFVDYARNALDFPTLAEDYIAASVNPVLDTNKMVPTEQTLDLFAELSNIFYSKVQLLCLLVILFLLFAIRKEKLAHRKMRKEMEIVGGIIQHNRWQKDIAEKEIQEVSSRLERNRTTRIPNIIHKVEEIYKLIDLKHQTLDQLFVQLDFLCPTVMSQQRKLRLINKTFEEGDDSDNVKEARNVGRHVDVRLHEINTKLQEMTEYTKQELEVATRLLEV